MHAVTEKLLELDRALIAALDGGDIDQFKLLVVERGALIDDLRSRFDAAPDAERRAIEPRLRILAERDENLRSRAAATRDQLGRRLTESTPNGGGQAHAPAASGIFDRRA